MSPPDATPWPPPSSTSPPPAPETIPIAGWYQASDGGWYETDQPPSAGWWLASDLRWYPPAPATWVPGEPWMSSRWGLGDLWWAVLVYVVGSIVLGLGVAVVDSAIDPDRPATEFDMGPYASALYVVLAQLAITGVVMSATHRKGLRSLRDDFGLRCRPVDVAIGFGVGVAALLVAGVVSTFLDRVLGADEATTNVPFESLRGGEVAAQLVAIGILTPIVEELLFRGLVNRSFRKRGAGALRAGLWTTLIFVVPHLAAVPEWPGIVTLFASIAVLGAAFQLASHWTDGRLGAPIVAHMVVNSTVVVALAFS